MMSIKSQQILRKIGAGILIILLLLFLSDYFRVKSDYGVINDNLEYSQRILEDVTLQISPSFMGPSVDKEHYYTVVKYLSHNKAYPYLLRKEIYIEADKNLMSKIETLQSCIVQGEVIQNNYGMIKMVVHNVSNITE